jgi:RNA polymerase sigma factor for flagellar operon FliA
MSQTLWDSYQKSRSIEDRNRLVLVHSPLVKWVVGRLPYELRRRIEAADLIGYGMIGLIDAVERFDSSQGYKFETYAVARVRGAIYDELRRLDMLPRGVRDRARQVETARAELGHSLGREPSSAEVAASMGLDERKMASLATDLLAAAPLSLEGYLDARPGHAPVVEDEGFNEVAERIDGEAATRRLREAIGQLPEREQAVIAMYYLEGQTLAAVGEVLGVTESRVSQLRSRAVKRLRAFLQVCECGDSRTAALACFG